MDFTYVLNTALSFLNTALSFLYAGPENVKMHMATALAEMELTDHHKASLLEGNVLGPLLHLVSHGDTQMKKAAAKALRNLSSVPKNGLQMIKEGAVGPLVDLLLHHSSSSSSLREETATAIMHLAVSTMYQESSQAPVTLLESDKDIIMLFSLINLTGPEVQQRILQTFNALCRSPSAGNIKTTLTQVYPHEEEVYVLSYMHVLSLFMFPHPERKLVPILWKYK